MERRADASREERPECPSSSASAAVWTSAAPRIFAALGGEHPRIKPEIFQSMVELNSGVCAGVDEALSDLRGAIENLRPLCESMDLCLVSAGSHPFARHEDRVVHPAPRFKELIFGTAGSRSA